MDPRTVVWKRVMDMNDRSLRHIVIGLKVAPVMECREVMDLILHRHQK